MRKDGGSLSLHNHPGFLISSDWSAPKFLAAVKVKLLQKRAPPEFVWDEYCDNLGQLFSSVTIQGLNYLRLN